MKISDERGHPCLVPFDKQKDLEIIPDMKIWAEAPLDSVSSMEVNIDSLELSEPLDISELEPSDAFQQSEDPMSPLFSPGNLQGTDYFRLRFPFSPSPGQQLPAHDGDTTDRQEEAADVQSQEHILNMDSNHSDHDKTYLSETQ
ncbi:uncharacterized protein LOC142759333 isoform X2 [Rhinoderma darwinii]|uniref:uncharacterized protein LOC142759333 isoform X2 n=1 Tax=Rhinoderma darwinii TaxID=43563 RepID=UPI003F663954